MHQAPEPPQPGRKKGEKDGKRGNNSKKRKKGINESPTKKKPKMLKRIMHCSQCGVANHNSRFHKKAQQVSLSFVVLTLLYLCDGSYGMMLLSQAPQRDSSQVESSQAQE